MKIQEIFELKSRGKQKKRNCFQFRGGGEGMKGVRNLRHSLLSTHRPGTKRGEVIALGVDAETEGKDGWRGEKGREDRG